MTAGAKQPLTLPNGEQRVFLEDGDRVVLHGRARDLPSFDDPRPNRMNSGKQARKSH
jgi:hypothetical protein